MRVQSSVESWWAALTVCAVVNAVNVLQGIGIATGSQALNARDLSRTQAA